MKMNFKDCTLAKLDDLVGLEEVEEMSALTEWLASHEDISDIERQLLENLRYKLSRNVNDWNETELTIEFIGPLLSLVNYSGKEFHFFAQRSFAGQVGNLELSGKPDGMITSGKRLPRKPYFCFQEYKREKDPEGEPAGQVLAAMLVAQELNEHHHPIYGCYIKGSVWRFIVLKDKEYSISPIYVADREEVSAIFTILKGLKSIIRELVQ